jgi:hypothetical protein
MQEKKSDFLFYLFDNWYQTTHITRIKIFIKTAKKLLSYSEGFMIK